jgi:choline-glycine betaine transporter
MHFGAIGGEDSISALRAVSIIAGVPYTVVLCFMCRSLWTILSEEYDKVHIAEVEQHHTMSSNAL